MTPTAEVTTLENEIERHRAIADLMRRFAFLCDNEKIFTPDTIANTHDQTARRLQQLKIILSQTKLG